MTEMMKEFEIITDDPCEESCRIHPKNYDVCHDCHHKKQKRVETIKEIKKYFEQTCVR